MCSYVVVGCLFFAVHWLLLNLLCMRFYVPDTILGAFKLTPSRDQRLRFSSPLADLVSAAMCTIVIKNNVLTIW